VRVEWDRSGLSELLCPRGNACSDDQGARDSETPGRGIGEVAAPQEAETRLNRSAPPPPPMMRIPYFFRIMVIGDKTHFRCTSGSAFRPRCLDQRRLPHCI
jgi:hypothetical protein